MTDSAVKLVVEDKKYNYDRINRNTRAALYRSRSRIHWDSYMKGTMFLGRNDGKREKRGQKRLRPKV